MVTSGDEPWWERGFEYRSVEILGVPLVHVIIDLDSSSLSEARAMIAVADRATGLVAIGGLATGLVAFGGIAIGLVSGGGLTLGIVAFGGGAVGLLAIGGGALGALAHGALAIGFIAVGPLAIGWIGIGIGSVAVHRLAPGVSDPVARSALASYPPSVQREVRRWLGDP